MNVYSVLIYWKSPASILPSRLRVSVDIGAISMNYSDSLELQNLSLIIGFCFMSDTEHPFWDVLALFSVYFSICTHMVCSQYIKKIKTDFFNTKIKLFYETNLNKTRKIYSLVFPSSSDWYVLPVSELFLSTHFYRWNVCFAQKFEFWLVSFPVTNCYSFQKSY